MQRKPLIIVTVILAIAVIFVIGLLLIGRGGLEYSPTDKNNRGGPIVIKASENIATDTGSYVIEPLVEGRLQVVDNFIVFWPQEGLGFIEDERYQAVFRGYETENGKPLGEVEINFTIDKDTKYSTLQNEVLSKYGRFEAEPSNPLLNELPHTEPYRYRVSYEINELRENEGKDLREVLGSESDWRSKKDNYTVIIETLVFQGQQDSLQTYLEEVANARQEALSWIKGLGVGVDDDIKYQFVPSDRQLTTPPQTEETEI